VVEVPVDDVAVDEVSGTDVSTTDVVGPDVVGPEVVGPEVVGTDTDAGGAGTPTVRTESGPTSRCSPPDGTGVREPAASTVGVVPAGTRAPFVLSAITGWAPTSAEDEGAVVADRVAPVGTGGRPAPAAIAPLAAVPSRAG
jgi:hypothetical protein